jgi:two-component system chemotaxis response regulator CheY
MQALVVGESKEVREVLTRSSFQVVEVGDVRAAMEFLASFGPVDLALVDWDLPAAGGLRFVRTVRASRDYSSMRLILVTTQLDMTEIFEAIRAGVDDYLLKPVTRKKLLEKLAQLRFYTT